MDIGGTGLKASVLDAAGAMVADRVKIPTPYPLPPDKLVPSLKRLVAPLPAGRPGVGRVPGMVRGGVVLSAPHFVTVAGPGTEVDHHLVRQWDRFDLAGALTTEFGMPTKAANDADIQGAAVVSGTGLELVITLGTGFGTGLFYEGELLPHLEIAHQPFRKGESYDDQLGEAARKQIGEERWNKRVTKAIANMRALDPVRPPLHRWRQFPPGAAAPPARRRDRGRQHGRHPRRHPPVGTAARWHVRLRAALPRLTARRTLSPASGASGARPP